MDVFRVTGCTGHPDHQSTFASGLDEPYGLAFHDGFLYVGNENAVVRCAYARGQTAAHGPPEEVTPLPPGGHSTRGVIFRRDGSKMYVWIGSASNVSAEGPPRASIMEYNPDGGGKRVLASGLRNPVGMAWNPTTGALWTAVNERDGMGDDLVPDYITEITDGAFYGWPYSSPGKNIEPRRKGDHPALLAQTALPSLLTPSHSAPPGLTI